jgi:hypothetical protein
LLQSARQEPENRKWVPKKTYTVINTHLSLAVVYLHNPFTREQQHWLHNRLKTATYSSPTNTIVPQRFGNSLICCFLCKLVEYCSLFCCFLYNFNTSFRRKPQNKRQYSTSKKSSGKHRRRAQQFVAERFGNCGGGNLAKLHRQHNKTTSNTRLQRWEYLS